MYQNDHKKVMADIEKELHKLHSESCVRVPRNKGSSSGAGDGDGSPNKLRLGPVGPPFASIDQVFEGSPAEEAGLLVNDRIKRFGSVSLLKGESVADCLRELPSQVSPGTAVEIVVENFGPDGLDSKSDAIPVDKRGERVLELVPRADWGGRGLLGCHIVPLAV